MNKLILMGTICKDIDVKQSQNGKSIARFTVAVQRKYKNSEGKYDSDFLPCVAFDKQASFVSQYFQKGSKIAIVGHMQSGSYEGKNGKVYTLDCYVDEAEFCGTKSSGSNNVPTQQSTPTTSSNDFMNVPDDLAEELPFN